MAGGKDRKQQPPPPRQPMGPPQGEAEMPQRIMPGPVPMDIDIVPVQTVEPDQPNYVMLHVSTQAGSNFFFIDVEAAEHIFLPDFKEALDQAKGSGIIVPPGIVTPENGSHIKSVE